MLCRLRWGEGFEEGGSRFRQDLRVVTSKSRSVAVDVVELGLLGAFSIFGFPDPIDPFGMELFCMSGAVERCGVGLTGSLPWRPIAATLVAL